MDAPVDLSDCTEVAATFYVDTERVTPYLPPGFTAAEGRLPGGVATSTTPQASVTVAALSCDASALEDGALDQLIVTVDVEKPATDAVEARETHQVYQLLTLTSGAVHLALLEGVGASAAPGTMEVEVLAASAGSAGSATATDEEGVLFEVEATGGGRAAFGVSARFWEVLPAGLLVRDWEQDDEPRVAYDLGQVATCAVRPGTLLHDLLGVTDCSTLTSVALVVPEWRTEGRLRVIPGGEVRA